MLKRLRKELDDTVVAREKALRTQRETIPLCAQAIRDIQKGNYTSAEKAVKQVAAKLKAAEAVLKRYPELKDNILGPAYQEYAELSIFLNFMKKHELPTLKVPAKFYLLGLGDAIGELKRVGLELLAEHKLKQAEELGEELENLYFIFSQMVYPNALIPGLKQKQDVARKVLNDFHNLILSHKLTRP
jgi:translin